MEGPGPDSHRACIASWVRAQCSDPFLPRGPGGQLCSAGPRRAAPRGSSLPAGLMPACGSSSLPVAVCGAGPWERRGCDPDCRAVRTEKGGRGSWPGSRAGAVLQELELTGRRPICPAQPGRGQRHPKWGAAGCWGHGRRGRRVQASRGRRRNGSAKRPDVAGGPGGRHTCAD